jgi:tRNA pseudouridine13 synthase
MLKTLPSDFQVTELSETLIHEDGYFSLYSLKKINFNTLDAIQEIRRSWHLSAEDISFGGLKDRHAVTSQFVSIAGGPKKDYQRGAILLQYLGKCEAPFSSEMISANHFEITLRKQTREQIEKSQRRLPLLQQNGVPNYFDDQRFGSVSPDRQFIAREWILGDPETALKLAILGSYEHDPSKLRKEKSELRKAWGDWKRSFEFAKHPVARRVYHFLLRQPQNFQGAMLQINHDLLTLYLSAYQSDLWNRILSRWILANTIESSLIETSWGKLILPDRWRSDVDFASQEIPYPSSRLKIDPESSMSKLINEVLLEDGISLDQMKLSVRKPFFSKGSRVAVVFPKTTHVEEADDELHPGFKKSILKFDLPRGAYATVVIKCLLAEANTEITLPSP